MEYHTLPNTLGLIFFQGLKFTQNYAEHISTRHLLQQYYRVCMHTLWNAINEDD